MNHHPKVAISIGDLNGIGIQLALENHHAIKNYIDPVYCIDITMLKHSAGMLELEIPDDFVTVGTFANEFEITPGKIDAGSGRYSYESFVHAVALTNAGKTDAMMTLPIHKKAWELAGIEYKGHTDALRDFFDAEAIMMLGTPQMYVALYTEHIPLREVANSIDKERLSSFLIDFYRETKPASPIAVLGLNPHAGDDGVLGDEEQIISKAIQDANSAIDGSHDSEIYHGPLVPDIAFIPNMRRRYKYYIAMYHDQGLAPLKALYFDDGINVSLNLPILRTSVDHGTAFDIAYQGQKLNSLSYINAIKYIANTI